MTQDALQGVAPRDAPFFWLDPGVPLRTATATASGTVYVRERVWRVDGSRPSCVRTSRALQPAHPALGHNNLVFVDPSESSLVPVEFPACRMRHLPPSLPDSASTRAVTPFRELALGSRQTSSGQLPAVRFYLAGSAPVAMGQTPVPVRCQVPSKPKHGRRHQGVLRLGNCTRHRGGDNPNVADHGLNGQPVIWR